MNRNYAISLAMACLASANALADDITVDSHPFVSTASRAQVQEELRQATMTGGSPWADTYNPLANFRSSTTSAEVTAGFLASRNAVAAFSAEDSGSSYLARLNAPAMRRANDLAQAQ